MKKEKCVKKTFSLPKAIFTKLEKLAKKNKCAKSNIVAALIEAAGLR